MTSDIGAVGRRVERFNEGWVFVPDAVVGDAGSSPRRRVNR